MIRQFTIVSLDDYIQEFDNQLHEEVCVFDKLFKQSVQYYMGTIEQKLKNYKGPLPLFYSEHSQLSDVVREETEAIFNVMDVSKLERIDAFEFLSSYLVLTQGPFKSFWKCIVNAFGSSSINFVKCISADELFYFFDTLFRGLPKLLIKKGEDPLAPNPKTLRVKSEDIKSIVSVLMMPVPKPEEEGDKGKDQEGGNQNDRKNSVRFVEYGWTNFRCWKDLKIPI